MDYKVMRPHLGDKPYQSGDMRSAKAGTVSHLVAKGVLAPIDLDDAFADGGQKTEEVASSEAGGPPKAPENKATEPAETAAQKPAATEPDPANQSKPKD